MVSSCRREWVAANTADNASKKSQWSGLRATTLKDSRESEALAGGAQHLKLTCHVVVPAAIVGEALALHSCPQWRHCFHRSFSPRRDTR